MNSPRRCPTPPPSFPRTRESNRHTASLEFPTQRHSRERGNPVNTPHHRNCQPSGNPANAAMDSPRHAPCATIVIPANAGMKSASHKPFGTTVIPANAGIQSTHRIIEFANLAGIPRTRQWTPHGATPRLHRHSRERGNPVATPHHRNCQPSGNPANAAMDSPRRYPTPPPSFPRTRESSRHTASLEFPTQRHSRERGNGLPTALPHASTVIPANAGIQSTHRIIEFANPAAFPRTRQWTPHGATPRLHRHSRERGNPVDTPHHRNCQPSGIPANAAMHSPRRYPTPPPSFPRTRESSRHTASSKLPTQRHSRERGNGLPTALPHATNVIPANAGIQ